VVDLILGIPGPDRRLARVAELVRPDTSAERLDLEPDVAAAVARAIRALDTSNAIVELRGPRGAGKRAVASAMAAELGRQLLVTDLTALASAELPPPVAIRLLRREARMAGALLLLSGADTVTDEAGAAALAADLRAPPAPTLLASRGPWSGRMEHLARGGLEIELSPPGYPARRRLWTEALDCDGPDVDIVAGRYVLTPGQIADAATLARHLASGGEPTVAELQEAARVQAATRLRDLAEKIEPRYGWDDIVLPAAQFEQMREIQDAIAHRHVVYGSWGFDRKLARGRGVTALFVGPSGTGKTMGAEVLAYELSLDLYRIDLAGVVSKYIGETEKNISRIFEEARTSNAILFFDEADALFGKRSEVRDAHDRYANIEVAHLLQEMESYEGIAILATNLPGDLDEAFARRLHHSVEFPFPDAEQRQRIWERVFPPEAPLDDGLDFAFLAGSLELSGGNIRNVALTAAFRAAASSERITMEHVLVAAARELRKIGELPSAAQFGEYAELAVLP
jgi:hypothetical protein